MKNARILRNQQIRKENQNLKQKARQKSLRIKKAQGKNLTFQLYKTMNHFFPDLYDRIREIEDFRKKSTYELAELIVACIAMSILKEGSRNAINNDRKEENFSENFERIFKIRLPHMDTVDNVMRRLEPIELERLKADLVRTLLAKKTLHKFRLFNIWFTIAIDGTGIMSFSERHCEHCLTKTSKKTGKVTYFHNVLEAKLICSNGFSISIATEWIENPVGDFDKQDCELKAFKRLADKLKEMFSRLPICITADGLYPNQTFFGICEKNKWSFIVTFKDGNLPSVWEEVNALRNITHRNKETRTIIRKEKKIYRVYTWVNDIPYYGFCLNWIECVETVENFESKKTKTTKFVHVTSFKIRKLNAVKISQAGRLRWKIENEGFNTQKNHGYNLKHKFSRVSLIAAKNYYQCIQIGHLINQLFILSSQFQDFLTNKVTVKHLWKCMIGFLVFGTVNNEEISSMDQIRIQIRFG